MIIGMKENFVCYELTDAELKQEKIESRENKRISYVMIHCCFFICHLFLSRAWVSFSIFLLLRNTHKRSRIIYRE